MEDDCEPGWQHKRYQLTSGTHAVTTDKWLIPGMKDCVGAREMARWLRALLPMDLGCILRTHTVTHHCL